MLKELGPLGNKRGWSCDTSGFYVFQDQVSGFSPTTTEYKQKLLRKLHEMKASLLQRVGGWVECPLSYRHNLLSRLRCIDIAGKEAFLKIDDIKRELRMLGFNLSLNPAWIRGLLKLIDEILDQTEHHQRELFSEECIFLGSQLSALKNACRLYQIEEEI